MPALRSAADWVAAHPVSTFLAVFAVWPNLVLQAGMPEKEQVLVALLPWIVSLAICKDGVALPFPKCLLVGILLGMATLVQPAVQLFPGVLLCYWFVSTRRTGPSLRMLGVAAAGTCASVP